MDIFGSKGIIECVNEGVRTAGKVGSATSWKEARPERSFKEQRYLINHDSRTMLSEDTYVQLIMGTGFKVKIPNNKKAEQAWIDWTNNIDFDTKLEDGLHSYVGVGNLIFKKLPLMADLEELTLSDFDHANLSDDEEITELVFNVDNREIKYTPENYVWLKMTNVDNEWFGRGLFHSIVTERLVDNEHMESPLISLWIIEDAMKKIFQAYASPIMMIHFEDAGEDFIKRQKEEFKKARPGAKIITDKAFEVKVFEVNPMSKFDKYIEHLQNDVMEPGVQFPIQYFNAGFTARAASETTDDAVVRKVKRIQRRLAKQLKKHIVIPYLAILGYDDIKPSEIDAMFEFDARTDLTAQDIDKLFEKGVIVRNELRDHLRRNTTLELDKNNDGNTPPITSVTPTNDLNIKKPEDKMDVPSGSSSDDEEEEELMTKRS